MPSEDKTGYKIWAVDNVVYGPVELPTLIAWIKEERILPASWIFSERADQWCKASDLEEARVIFRKMTTGTAATAAAAVPGKVAPNTLRRVKVLSALSDALLARFLEFVEVQKIRQFTAVVKQGDPGDAMFFVLEGEVRVRMAVGEQEKILALLSVGDFFGEISLFDHGPRSADVISNTDTTVLRLSASSFQKLSEKAPELAAPFLLAMGRTLTGRIRADNKRYKDTLTFTTLPE